MPKTLPISEVKARLPELVTGVAEGSPTIAATAEGQSGSAVITVASAAGEFAAVSAGGASQVPPTHTTFGNSR